MIVAPSPASAGAALMGSASGPALGLGAESSFAIHLQSLSPVESASPSSTEAALKSAVEPIMDALKFVDQDATALQGAVNAVQAGGGTISPGDMIMLSMRCNEFLFHCELTSNIASRSSDGLQQLFREQG
jgi:hypothetical protein